MPGNGDDIEKIDFNELKRRLADPDYDEKKLADYLVGERIPENGLAPTLIPNPATVTGGTGGEGEVDLDSPRVRGKLGMGFLNGYYKNRRRRRFQRDIDEGRGKPILLAEGDSWFEYPIWLKDTIDCLMEDHTIYCVSGAGDELEDMVNATDPEYEDALRFIMERRRLDLRGILLSGGGNDIVGETFHGFLKTFDAARPAEWHIDPQTFDPKFRQIADNYRAIIGDIQRTWPGIPIFVHGYDHAVPLPDQGFRIPPLDGWLGDWLRDRRIEDEAMQREIVKRMIDRFYDMLREIVDDPAYPGVHLVDNRGVVGADWHDELHPNDDGYGRVAGRFREAMEKAGIVGVRDGAP